MILCLCPLRFQTLDPVNDFKFRRRTFEMVALHEFATERLKQAKSLRRFDTLCHDFDPERLA